MFKNFVPFTIILIVTLGLIMRLYMLAKIPNGFANDEAAISYQAYSVLKTGKDTWGNLLPLTSFKDFGEHLPVLTVYAMIPSIFLLGLNEFSTRLPHVLISTADIFIVYLISQQLFNKKRISLTASLFFAISPLSIGWSRFVYEGNFGMLFYLLGMYFYLASRKKIKLLVLSLLCFTLTLATYHIYYVVTPLTILFLYPLQIGKVLKNKPLTIVILILGFLFITYYLLVVKSGAGRERFRQVSIFSRSNTIQQLNDDITLCRKIIPQILCKAYYNKPRAYFSEYSYNYLFHFSPTFLALNGTFLRGVILPITGIIYSFQLPFFYAGLVILILKRNFSSYILIVWLLIYPFANSFTGVGEISRITHALALFQLISALGVYTAYNFIKNKFQKKIFLLGLLMLTFLNVSSFFVKYFVVFPISNSKNASFAYVVLFKEIALKKDNFKNYFITRDYTGNTPEYQARIFLPINPNAFQNPSRRELLIRKPEEYINYNRLDNFYFFQNTNEIHPQKNDLVILSENQLQKDYRVLFEVKESDGKPVLFAIDGSNLLNEK